MSSSNQGQNRSGRIWLNDELFLSVTYEGYATGPCYEGALGCVLQLLPSQVAIDNSKNKKTDLSAIIGNCVALKIPRMMADTITENAHISAILQDEEEIVFKAGASNRNTGLVPSAPGLRGLLKGFRAVPNGIDQEARLQSGSVLFISFSKGRFPRFCSVRKREDGTFDIYPKGAEKDFTFLTTEAWDFIIEESTYGDRQFYKSTSCEILVETPSTTKKVRISELERTVKDLQSSSVWYIGLPSIAYAWASGTLQETITKMKHANWHVRDHYSLLLCILKGTQSLHERGLLHADIRPANIMALGPASTPDSFLLGDYGSFSMNDHILMLEGTADGHTTLAGPGISRHRTSIFYSPERRNGVERETADTAVILCRTLPPKNTIENMTKAEPSVEYLVHFGWHNDLVDRATGRLRSEIHQRLIADWQQMVEAEAEHQKQSAVAGWNLCRGDRLRVRDYVFIILDSDVIDGRLYFRCYGRYAQVLHERIAINVQGETIIENEKIINIPHYVEIRQWSVATDMYGIGVLSLYILFSSGLAISSPSAVEMAGNIARNTESMLTEIVSLLESEQNFIHLWGDLELFRISIEEHGRQLAGKQLATQIINIDKDNSMSLYEFGRRVVGNIRRTTKYIDFLLQKFNYNVAHFLLFFHFVVACLHRQTSLAKKDKDAKKPADPIPSFPFCIDRCEPTRHAGDGASEDKPANLGPATRAAERLRELRVRFDQERYNEFHCNPKELPSYDPASEWQIRIQKDELERKTAVVEQEAKTLRDRLESQKKIHGEALERRSKDHNQVLDKLQDEHKNELTRIAEQQGIELMRLRETIGNLKATADERKQRADKAESLISQVRSTLANFSPTWHGNSKELIADLNRKLNS